MQLIWRKKGDPSVRPADLFLAIRPDLVQSSSRKYTLSDHVYVLVILSFSLTSRSRVWAGAAHFDFWAERVNTICSKLPMSQAAEGNLGGGRLFFS